MTEKRKPTKPREWLTMKTKKFLYLIVVLFMFSSVQLNFLFSLAEEEQYRYSTNISDHVRIEVYENPDENYSIIVKVLDDFDSTGNFTPSQGNLTAAIVLHDGRKDMEVIVEKKWNGSSSTILNANEAGNYTIYGGVEREGKVYFDRTEFEIKEHEKNNIPVAVAFLMVGNRRYNSTDNIEFYLPEKGYEDIVFNGSLSYDLDEEDNTSLEYWWTIFYSTDDYTVKKGMTIKWRFWDPGDYTVKLRVSDGKSWEGGGITYINFTILRKSKPDVQFETTPSLKKFDYEIGQYINFSFRVVNKGDYNSPNFNVSVTLHQMPDGKEFNVFKKEVKGLEIFSTELINVSILTSELPESSYNLEIKLDPENLVNELNEENNNLTFYNITLYRKPIEFVDLRLKNVTLEKEVNEEIRLGEAIGIRSPVTITVTVENRGSGTAHWVEVLLYVDNETVDTQRIDEIKGQDEGKVRFVWYSKINGTRHITVELKYEDKSLEKKELDLYVVTNDTKIDNNPKEEGFFRESNLDVILFWSGLAAIAIAMVMTIFSKYSGGKSRGK
ncbi:MAG TPA: hypothetical protein EYP29_05750 [Thermoplasmata archaeon]|nr:hypothetical protein [Thermoplasmata archaeon]